MSRREESNLQPLPYEGIALPLKLRRQVNNTILAEKGELMKISREKFFRPLTI